MSSLDLEQQDLLAAAGLGNLPRYRCVTKYALLPSASLLLCTEASRTPEHITPPILTPRVTDLPSRSPFSPPHPSS